MMPPRWGSQGFIWIANLGLGRPRLHSCAPSGRD